MIPPAELVAKIAASMFETLASTFPVACASDEFFYFPQVRLSELSWEIWDDFSTETNQDIVEKLSAWENQLKQLNLELADLENQVDIALLIKFITTLREQLSEVCIWRWQPSFYLTLANLGLAEAMASDDPSAKHQRAKNLPDFLKRASKNLYRVPALFRDIGLTMVLDTRNYFTLLEEQLPDLRFAQNALDHFEATLLKLETREDFALSPEILTRVIRYHLNSEMDLTAVNEILDREIFEMKELMDEEAHQLVPDLVSNQESRLLSNAISLIPLPAIGADGLIGLYNHAVNRLAQHCVDQKIISDELVTSCPVSVVPVPAYLSAIRTASSYSIAPKNPPAGGTFYVNNAEVAGEENQDRLREFRMLSAHETYPGHHLLDTSRWSLIKSIRRYIEQPIFYEGWACFAEELMRLTGYFSNPGDRLLLAKRRLWRAVRGKVDLGLQTGAMNFSTAVDYLKKTGTGAEWAMASIRKYPLNPGYQLCYAIGLRHFLDLFDRYGRNNLQKFVQTVLQQGEINFADLERVFRWNN